jgi:EAL domain-containing protein (putative c-di-GMP-specific phosphodiesterase class I)
LTVDDFGTGVSSLMVMQRLPIHSLKIDRSLVAALPGDPNSLAVAGAVIDVAHRFGALAVAEGVETQAQVDLLVAERCDQMQGFLFSHPLPAEEIGAYLERTLRTESTAVMRIIKASEKAADDAVPAQKGRRKAAGGGSAA